LVKDPLQEALAPSPCFNSNIRANSTKYTKEA